MFYNHIRNNFLSNVLSPVSTVNCQLQKLLSQKKGFSCPVPTLGGDGHFWTMAIDQIASSKWWCHIRTVLQSFNIFIKWYAAVLVVCTVHHMSSAQMALPLSSHLQLWCMNCRSCWEVISKLQPANPADTSTLMIWGTWNKSKIESESRVEDGGVETNLRSTGHLTSGFVWVELSSTERVFITLNHCTV